MQSNENLEREHWEQTQKRVFKESTDQSIRRFNTDSQKIIIMNAMQKNQIDEGQARAEDHKTPRTMQMQDNFGEITTTPFRH